VDRIEAGDHAGAAEEFVDTVVLGTGAWAQLPTKVQETLIENAPTFLDEARDPEQLAFNLERIKEFSRPTMLTRGDQSPPIFSPVVTSLAEALPCAEIHTFHGAGHIPHATHPDAYVEAILAFTRNYAS
jgi:pimeloyl-ACP methyl ester carboxylesterase